MYNRLLRGSSPSHHIALRSQLPSPSPSPTHFSPYPSAPFRISNASPARSGGGLLSSLSPPAGTPSGPSPHTNHCSPNPRSHVAWKMPHSLNAQGTSPAALAKKNHILKVSPRIQFAMTDGRNPLQPRRWWFARSWGSGSVASTVSAM